ncbi:MAG TPA: hypothetical protein VK641_02105 [Terriglobales bacterium]|nr:hypothetical protein [Terriglobales bacterium]
MADVGEETAFDLIHLGELPVALFELLFIFLQLIRQAKFAEAEAVKEVIPGHNNDSSQAQEVEVVHEARPIACERSALGHSGYEIHEHHAGDRDERFDEVPARDHAHGQQDKIQARVIG